MKIGQQQPEVKTAATQPVQPASGQQVGQSTSSSSSGRTERGTRAASSSPSVGVTVSESARALESAAADSSADVDMDKVNAARQAIENNTFVVNPETIADRLLANAREMLQRSAS